MCENRKAPLNIPRKFAPKQTHSRNAVSVNAMKEGDVLSGKAVHCDLCRGDHKLWHCASFKETWQKERFEFVRKYKLCFNCLQPGHRVGDCGLHRKCRKRGKKHLLCFVLNIKQKGRCPKLEKIQLLSLLRPLRMIKSTLHVMFVMFQKMLTVKGCIKLCR